MSAPRTATAAGGGATGQGAARPMANGGVGVGNQGADSPGWGPPPPGFMTQEDQQQKHHKLQPNEAAAATKAANSTDSAGNDKARGGPRNERSNSFSNLAAALGTGLAESMDISTRSSLEIKRQSAEGQVLVDAFAKGAPGQPGVGTADQDLSYSRMMRHAGSRILGNAPNPGDAFTASSNASAAPGFSSSEADSILASLNLSDAATPNAASSAAAGGLRGSTIFDDNTNLANAAAYGARPSGAGAASPGMKATTGLTKAFSDDALEHTFQAGGLAATTHRSGSTNALNHFKQNHQSHLQTYGQNQQFPQHGSNPNFHAPRDQSRLSATKDLGVVVMEPSESASAAHNNSSNNNHAVANGGVPGAGAGTNGTANLGGLLNSNAAAFRNDGRQIELERGMQSLWSNEAPPANGDGKHAKGNGVGIEAAAAGNNGGTSLSSAAQSASSQAAENALRQFTWDSRHQESSRMLAIIRAFLPSPTEVRLQCERYGSIETFRADFSDKGVYFVGYYDMRSAQTAARDLQPYLQQQQQQQYPPSGNANSNGNQKIEVSYCVPLNSSSQFDESLVILTDIPSSIEIDHLLQMLSMYGKVRSLKSHGGMYSGSSYVVEYHDVQDAKQAVLELESSQPWGPNVMVEYGPRNPSDRKRGRELLALIGRWRRESSSGMGLGHGGRSDSHHQLPHHQQGANGGGGNSNNAHMMYGGHGNKHGSRGSFGMHDNGMGGSNTSYGPHDRQYNRNLMHNGRNDYGYDNGYNGHDNNHLPHDSHLGMRSDRGYNYGHMDRNGAPYGRENGNHYPYGGNGGGGSGGGHRGGNDYMNHGGGGGGGGVSPHHNNRNNRNNYGHNHHAPNHMHQQYPNNHPQSHQYHNSSQYQHGGSGMSDMHGSHGSGLNQYRGGNNHNGGSSNYHSHHHDRNRRSISPPYPDGHHGHNHRSYGGGGGRGGYSRDSHHHSDDKSIGGNSHSSKYSHGDNRSVGAHSTGMSTLAASATDEKDKRNLTLDLEMVEAGHDTRTSLMVRNIPNKYTQKMLLSEFKENGHGPGVIDFFYLPIDFKNRCNRGYAFINFVNYTDILHFHKRYFGKHWRTFNSDKICDITYARIQGKAAMLKRFENSALMEKDEEYKPLVFVSNGPDKGMRLPFSQNTSSSSSGKHGNGGGGHNHHHHNGPSHSHSNHSNNNSKKS